MQGKRKFPNKPFSILDALIFSVFFHSHHITVPSHALMLIRMTGSSSFINLLDYFFFKVISELTLVTNYKLDGILIFYPLPELQSRDDEKQKETQRSLHFRKQDDEHNYPIPLEFLLPWTLLSFPPTSKGVERNSTSSRNST